MEAAGDLQAPLLASHTRTVLSFDPKRQYEAVRNVSGPNK